MGLYEVEAAIFALYIPINSQSLGRAEGCDIGKLRAGIDCNGYLLTETNSLIWPKSVWLAQIVFYKNVNCVVKISHLHARSLTRASVTSISLLIIPCMIVYVTNKQEPWRATLSALCTSADLAFINPPGQRHHSLWIVIQYNIAFCKWTATWAFAEQRLFQLLKSVLSIFGVKKAKYNKSIQLSWGENITANPQIQTLTHSSGSSIDNKI